MAKKSIQTRDQRNRRLKTASEGSEDTKAPQDGAFLVRVLADSCYCFTIVTVSKPGDDCPNTPAVDPA